MPPYITESFDVKIARVCMALTTGTGYPVLNYVARLAIQDVKPSFFGSEYSVAKTVPLTIFFTGATVGAAILVKALSLDIGFCMTLIGSTSATLIQFVFPGLMIKKISKEPNSSLNKTMANCAGNSMIVGGTLVGCLGVFIAIADVICAPKDMKMSGFCKAMGLNTDVS